MVVMVAFAEAAEAAVVAWLRRLDTSTTDTTAQASRGDGHGSGPFGGSRMGDFLLRRVSSELNATPAKKRRCARSRAACAT